ncbi:MAG: hypothetical protein QW400_04690 [Candidatus Diapherotrites archaeon]
MPQPSRRPQKPQRRKEKRPAGMESLFPEMRPAVRKAAEIRRSAAERARLIWGVADALAAKGYLERGQADRLKVESRRVLKLLQKGRLTAKEAAYFLNMTEFVRRYLEL